MQLVTMNILPQHRDSKKNIEMNNGKAKLEQQNYPCKKRSFRRNNGTTPSQEYQYWKAWTQLYENNNQENFPQAKYARTTQSRLFTFLQYSQTQILRAQRARSGRWTTFENNFAVNAIREFEAGTLELPSGMSSLRQYIAHQLNCSPMRVSKKYYIPKERNNHVIPPVEIKVPETTSLLRRGRWTDAETHLVAAFIAAFQSAALPLPPTTSLRNALSTVLQCDPMRVSKKYTGTFPHHRYDFYVDKSENWKFPSKPQSMQGQLLTLETLFKLEGLFINERQALVEAATTVLPMPLPLRTYRIQDLLN